MARMLAGGAVSVIVALAAAGLLYGGALTLCELRLWWRRRRVLRVGGR